MTTTSCSLTDLSDRELLEAVKCLAANERQATARLVASLAEFDARRLYLGEGCSCLFTYCVQVLHLSEHAAFNRIEAARAARRFPLILERLADGSVHLTAVRLLASKLTAENHRTMLDAVRHKSKREIEHLIARMNPRPDVAPSVRKLPAPAAPRQLVEQSAPVVLAAEAKGAASQPPLEAPSPPGRPPIVSPLAPERYRVQFTVSKATHDKLRRVQDLMRHRVPNGDPALIFDRALTALLAELERTKLAATTRPRQAPAVPRTSRHVPAPVKRAVWARDGGQCAFVGSAGRCRETGFLEFHHIVPYAAGGETSVENLELRCRAHNAYEAEKYFGRGSLFVRERSRDPWGGVGLVPERATRSDLPPHSSGGGAACDAADHSPHGDTGRVDEATAPGTGRVNGFPARACASETCGRGAGWRSMRVCRQRRPLPRNGLPRIPPCRPVRRWW
jgi:HNH endonuclease